MGQCLFCSTPPLSASPAIPWEGQPPNCMSRYGSCIFALPPSPDSLAWMHSQRADTKGWIKYPAGQSLKPPAAGCPWQGTKSCNHVLIYLQYCKQFPLSNSFLQHLYRPEPSPWAMHKQTPGPQLLRQADRQAERSKGVSLGNTKLLMR